MRGLLAAVLAALVLVTGYRAFEQDDAPGSEPVRSVATAEADEGGPGSLYGRIVTYDGTTYEGRLRWGGDEEAFWDNYYNGYKDENPWALRLPAETFIPARRSLHILGFEISRGEREVDLGRPFMMRFGDIARIDAIGDGVRGVLESGIAFSPDVRVTLKSGAVFNLARLEAGDFDDGVRVWDGQRGVVDLGPRQIRTIEFLPGEAVGAAPNRLYGTVHTRHGDFTGFLQWNREQTLGSDLLVGHADGDEHRLRFDTIRSIARHTQGSSRVTLLDGREFILSGTWQVGRGNRGVYVDDARYGRVLVSWEAFEHVALRPHAGSPAYEDFPPGRSLTGTVVTRTGRRLAGRLVYDLDESETTETLDAPYRGVDYTLPFGLIAAVVPSENENAVRVLLKNGVALHLERAGDLGAENAGLLVFTRDEEHPEYVAWTDVVRVDFDGPVAAYLPLSKP